MGSSYCCRMDLNRWPGSQPFDHLASCHPPQRMDHSPLTKLAFCLLQIYTDGAISVYWIRQVLDPQTKGQAGNKPRLLIGGWFGTHELWFYHQNNLVLYGLP